MKRPSTAARTPTPGNLRRRPAPLALAACLFAALLGLAGAASAQTNAPAEEVMDSAQTPAGELSLVRRRGADEAVTIVIKLRDRVVAEKGASEEGDAYTAASFHGLYPKAAPRYALVGMATGALVCGAKFTIVDLSREGAPTATKEFGNCSDGPRVAYRRGTLTVTFPAGPRNHDPGTHYVGPGQVWTYSSGRLRQLKRR